MFVTSREREREMICSLQRERGGEERERDGDGAFNLQSAAQVYMKGVNRERGAAFVHCLPFQQ